MSKETKTAPFDGKTEGSCTMTTRGITVNVRYTRPDPGSDNSKAAAKQFRCAFYELSGKCQTASSKTGK